MDRALSVVVVHNYYQQPGGEDQVFRAECALLEAHGHHVSRYTVHNDQVAGMSPVALAAASVWNGKVYRELRALARHERPDVAHFHNTLPLISPAAYYAARAEGVPVIQTLHNYRLLCPSALLFRDGHTCEDCLCRRVPWPGVLHACYRDSRAASGAVAAMLALHGAAGTWAKKVDVYIALTAFARDKFVEGGLPAGKIVVKPNFVEDRRSGAIDGAPREGALFVGRLSSEKGVYTLLEAWSSLDMPLQVVGDGPLLDLVRTTAAPQIASLGRKPPGEVAAEMERAAFLVMPSEWYETFGMTIIEAFCHGLPVIASRLGAMAEIVEDGVTGLHFAPGDPQDLAAKVRWASAHPEEIRRLGENARRVYEELYTPEVNYRQLMAIYDEAAQAAC